jgi:hypothetical protein
MVGMAVNRACGDAIAIPAHTVRQALATENSRAPPPSYGWARRKSLAERAAGISHLPGALQVNFRPFRFARRGLHAEYPATSSHLILPYCSSNPKCSAMITTPIEHCQHRYLLDRAQLRRGPIRSVTFVLNSFLIRLQHGAPHDSVSVRLHP